MTMNGNLCQVREVGPGNVSVPFPTILGPLLGLTFVVLLSFLGFVSCIGYLLYRAGRKVAFPDSI